MKNNSIRFVSFAAIVAGFAAAFSGCSKQTRSDASASVKDAYADSKAAMAKGWDEVKSFTFDKRNDFVASAKAMSSKLDVQLAEVRTNYSEAKASASRKAAMAELKNAEADYKEKLAALGNATAATWDSGKQNVILAWDKVQAAYYKARAE
ncbi:MAG: hypothetical protein ABIZ49_07105 [Opitutaceae bacterium]